MGATLNPQFKTKYAAIYHDVFKPLKAECERIYDEQNPTGYMNHAQRDTAINDMVFAQMMAPRDHQTEVTRDALGKFRQSLGVNEWDSASQYIPAFIADVRENGLTNVVMALPKDNRMTQRFGVAGPQTNAPAAMPKEGEKPIHPLSAVHINPELIKQFKAAQAIRA